MGGRGASLGDEGALPREAEDGGDADVTAEPGAASESLALLPAPSSALSGADASLVATCADARHPRLAGRVLARIGSGAPGEPALLRWVPTLQGLAVREGDRLLLARPSNFPEPIVVGVIDGFAERPEPLRRAGAEVALGKGEVLRVTTEDGEPVAEVRKGERGPIVRLLSESADVEVSGDLRVSARSLELVARSGEAKLVARGDVVVEGENIQLN